MQLEKWVDTQLYPCPVQNSCTQQGELWESLAFQYNMMNRTSERGITKQANLVNKYLLRC